MSETNFKPLFEYFDNRFDDLSGRINRVEGKVDILQASVDSFAKITKNTQEEILVINNRLEKIEAKS